MLLNITLLSLVTWLLLGIVTPTYAQEIPWSAPEVISAAGETAWFPDIAVDAAGRAHVAWSTGVTGFDTVNYRVREPDGAWSVANDIMALPANAGSEATRPALLVDDHDILHMSFRDTTIWYSQAHAAVAVAANQWRQPVDISEGYFSDLLMDPAGTLHLVYTQNVTEDLCPICYHLYYVRSADNGSNWSEPVDVSIASIGTAKPQLLFDEGILHLVWEQGPGGAYGRVLAPTVVMYAKSADNGQTWSLPTQLGKLIDTNTGTNTNTDADTEAGTEASTRNIVIGKDALDALVVVSWSIPEDRIYYQLSGDQGESWSAPMTIPGVWGIWGIYNSELDRYAMATDSAGNLHLLLVGRLTETQTEMQVIHLVWDGNSWSRPDVVQTFEGDAPEWPGLAVGLGNQLHAVWFVRDEAHIFRSDENPQYKIWYSQAKLESSPLPPRPLSAIPESTLAATTSDEEVAISTPRAQLSEEARAGIGPVVSMGEIRSENDEVLLLLASVLPAIALVALTMIIVLRRRG